MSSHQGQSQALKDVWELIQRYRSRFVLPAFLAAAVVLLVGILLPRKYQAEATFERRNDMVLTEMTNRGATQTFQNPRGSASEEIIGPPAIDQLLESIGPELASGRVGRRVGTDIAGLRADLSRMLLIHYDINSQELDRIRVAYTAVNPELARLVVNKLVENYIQRTRLAMDGRLKESAEFFEGEVARERKAIEEIENQMLTFEISHAEMLPDSPNSIQAETSQVQAQLTSLEERMGSAVIHEKAMSDAVNGTTATAPSVTTGPNPEYDRLEAKLRELQGQLANDLGALKMTEKHPDVIALHSQIAAAKKQLQITDRQTVIQTQTSANPKHDEMDVLLTTARADRQALDTQLKAVREHLAKLQAESTTLFPVRADYRKLSRDADQHRRQLTFWEDNLRRVHMALTAESGNRGVRLDFIKPCGELTRPVSPNLAQVLLAALGLGGLAGAAGVFLAHRTDDSFTDAQSLSSVTRLPLLGSVSEIISDKQRRTRRLRAIFFYPTQAVVMLVILLALGAVLYLSLEKPDSFSLLKTNPVNFVLHPATATASADDGTNAAREQLHMYNEFYHFNSHPFENTPDPRYFFASEQHREALAAIEYVIRMRKGYVLVTGDIGSGKTTVGRTMLERCGRSAQIIGVLHGHDTSEELLRQVLVSLGARPDPHESRAMLLGRLQARLLSNANEQRPIVLYVDEAQTLSDNALEELRLLSNFDSQTQKSVQVVLIGQPELRRRLGSPRFAALRQRIVLAKQISPLGESEARAYILHRLRTASEQPDNVGVAFSPAAIAAIYAQSGGVPRLINFMCDNALLIGFVQQAREITPEMVRRVIADMVPTFGDADCESREPCLTLAGNY